jgi:hypothetical protein
VQIALGTPFRDITISQGGPYQRPAEVIPAFVASVGTRSAGDHFAQRLPREGYVGMEQPGPGVTSDRESTMKGEFLHGVIMAEGLTLRESGAGMSTSSCQRSLEPGVLRSRLRHGLRPESEKSRRSNGTVQGVSNDLRR